MGSEILLKLREAYCEALRVGSSDGAHEIIDQGLARGIVPLKLYLDVIIPGQFEIYHRRHNGEGTLPQERISIQIALRQMARLRALFKLRVKSGLKAVVSSVEGDPHFVDAQAVADLLAADGWQVEFLGADFPTIDLVAFAREHGAHLVYASCSLVSLVPVAARLVRDLHILPQPPQVIVGGFAFTINPGLVGQVQADAYAADPQQAVAMARQVCNMAEAENSLGTFLKKLGNSVHEYRKLRGLSQQELARASDLDRAYISAVENGKQNISLGAVSKLAKALDLSIEGLLIGNEHPHG